MLKKKEELVLPASYALFINKSLKWLVFFLPGLMHFWGAIASACSGPYRQEKGPFEIIFQRRFLIANYAIRG